jgi:hypothetical protein
MGVLGGDSELIATRNRYVKQSGLVVMPVHVPPKSHMIVSTKAMGHLRLVIPVVVIMKILVVFLLEGVALLMDCATEQYKQKYVVIMWVGNGLKD